MSKLMQKSVVSRNPQLCGVIKFSQVIEIIVMLCLVSVLASCSQSIATAKDEGLESQDSSDYFYKVDLFPMVFNWQYYLDAYPDLRANGVTTEAQARQHWLNGGIYEGRQGSIGFSPNDYLRRYGQVKPEYPYPGSKDFRYHDVLDKVFTVTRYQITHDFPAASDDFPFDELYTYRQGMGRVDVLSSEVFDPVYYLAINSDLRAAGYETASQAAYHWLAAGIYEGRVGSPNFNVRTYLNRNPDLQQAFQGYLRYAKALSHYIEVGKSEGRSGK